MSWRLLLSEYPDALLSDQLAMVILVLLERGGLVTELELQQELEVDSPTVIRKLVALHHDKCIEYSRDHLRISDRGRLLIDRFALNDDIVDDLLHGLPVSAGRRDFLKSAILRYRNSAFQQYLNSVKAIRFWSRASRLPALKDPAQPDLSGIGSLALLISDLRHHLKDEHEIAHLSGHGTHMSGLMSGSDSLGTQLPMDDAAHTAIAWLAACHNLEESKAPWKEVKLLDTPGLPVFFAFQFSRKAFETSRWLDEWEDDGRSFMILSKCNSGREASERFGELWETNWRHESGLFSERVLGNVRQRVDSTLPLGNVADFLIKLFAASSLDHLVRTTGLSREPLELLLNQIRSHCDMLLPKREPDESELGTLRHKAKKEG